MDRADLELFERSLAHATEQHTGAALDAALHELGWREAMADDRRAAVSVLFGLQGAANTTSSALDLVMGDALGLDAATARGLVLPAIGKWAPPGRLDGRELRLHGMASAASTAGEHLWVVAATDADPVAVAVPTSALDLRPIEGVDPDLGLVEVTGEAVPIDGSPERPDLGWTAAVAGAQLALAHQLVGASRKMLELARAHALERIQFDRPISSFQAVRHRLAETLVAIETAEAVIDAAWLDGSPGTAAMAKAVAGREARTTARHCQQVLAGIGFTTEHPFQRYVRRVLVLDGLFGSSRTLTRALGDELLTTRHLPPLLPL